MANIKNYDLNAMEKSLTSQIQNDKEISESVRRKWWWTQRIKGSLYKLGVAMGQEIDKKIIQELPIELKDSLTEKAQHIGKASRVKPYDDYKYSIGPSRDRLNIKFYIDDADRYLWRPSWYPRKYPEGIDDIYSLYIHGFKTRDYVYKKKRTIWGEKTLRSRRFLRGNSFISYALMKYSVENSTPYNTIYIKEIDKNYK